VAAGARHEHQYGIVLVLVVASFAVQEAAPDGAGAQLAVAVLQGATLIVAMRVADVRLAVRRATGVAVLVALAVAFAAVPFGGEVTRSTTRLISGLLAAVAPVAIARGVLRLLRREQGVTAPAVAGALSIYLLVGMFFAFLDGAVATLQRAAFFADGRDGDASDHLYFSYVTLTTTGYGDLVAATKLGRTLAVLEALLGQIYLVTVVALAVGNLGRGRRRESGR
jgi:voltage-gated potassium channel Kch